MPASLRPALTLMGILVLLTGLAYPVAVAGVAWLLFPRQAGGSLVERDGIVLGSELIGQPFHGARYFHGRPSATRPRAYDAASSGGSNLGPTNPRLEQTVARRLAALRAEDPAQRAPVPIDLVTASASGLDPHLSPAAAFWQVPRVARARHLREDQVRALVEQMAEDRTAGILGEPRVNVLLLNLALDRLEGGGGEPGEGRR
ncbi:MAG TPA: potassium-transporting ATPase subunit KdpC [Candidatus Polarisedimenticolia bacterium]|nr:potassium-transporting ATPase subunit KdpC [Candidatus Polarisedimenticolia bacterium]